MQFRYRLVAAWAIATVASILVAFAAVASVRTAITDPPSALLLPDTTTPPLELPPLSEIEQTTVPDPEVDDGTPVATTDENSALDEPENPEATEAPAPSTTEAAPAEPASTESTPVTTAAPTTSTTQPVTTQPPSELVESYETDGGWVTLKSNEQGVFLESASPKPGWTATTEGSGPEHFTVVFKSRDREIHFKVEFENGRVEVDIED